MGQCKICGKEIADGQDICEACQSDLDNVEVDVSDIGDLDISLEDFDLPELSGDLLETDLEFNLEDPSNNLENPDIVVRDPEPKVVEEFEQDISSATMEGDLPEPEMVSQGEETKNMDSSDGEDFMEPNQEGTEESVADLLGFDMSLEEEKISNELPGSDNEVVEDLPDLGLDMDGDLPKLDEVSESDGSLDVLLSDAEDAAGMDLSGLLPEDLMAEVTGEVEPEDHLADLMDEPTEDAAGGEVDFLNDLDLGFDGNSDSDISMLHDLPDAEEIAELATSKPKVSIWKRLFGNLKDEKWEKQKEKEAKAEEARLAKEEAKKAKEAEALASSEGEGGEGEAETVDPKDAKKAAKLAKKEEKAKKKAEKKEEKERLKELAEEEDGDEGRINRVGAVIVFGFFGIVAALIIVGTNSFSYNSSITKAETYFEEDEYTAAYSQLAGLNIKSKDQKLYDKVRMVMYVDKELNSYQNYTNIRMYPEALDSLIKGLEKYDAHIQNAEELDVTEDYDKLRARILSEMENEYNLKEEDAYKLMKMEDQAAYSDKVIAIANE